MNSVAARAGAKMVAIPSAMVLALTRGWKNGMKWATSGAGARKRPTAAVTISPTVSSVSDSLAKTRTYERQP